MIEYTNRRGERYYLLQGKTKTGKPKYYVSRKPTGAPVEEMPAGYELHEEPERGLVSVRKIRTSRVTAAELQTLTAAGKQAGVEYFIVDVQGDSLVVHTPSQDPSASVALLGKLFGPLPGVAAVKAAELARTMHYLPMLRFTLVDEDARLFAVERWCFKGSINGWWQLPGRAALAVLAAQYMPHVDKESFFDLM